MKPSRRFSSLRVIFGAAVVLALLFAMYTNRVWEDYYITFRSSKNLATGNGLVYNVGDRLHTFTSPLGVLLPAISSFVTGNQSDTAALWLFRGMCAAAFGGAATLLVSLMRKLAWPAIASGLLAVLLITDAKSLDFTINGMETAFMLLFLAYALWAHLSPGPRQWCHLGGAWAGLMWTRPDSFIYIGLIAIGCWLFNRPDNTGGDRRQQIGLFLKAGLLTTALYSPWLIWAGWYYGTPVPHTIVAKAAMTAEGEALQKFLHGVWQLPYLIWKGATAGEGTFLPSYYVFPTWPEWSLPFGRVLAIITSLLWIVPRLRLECRIASFAYFFAISYLSFVPYFPFPWYLPATTLLAWVALAGAAGQLWQLNKAPLRWILGAGSITLIAAISSLTVAAAKQARAQQTYVEDGNRRLIGEWLREHSKTGDTVFMEPLGYIGFFSGLKTYDWPGMSNREVPAAAKLLGNDWSKIITYLKPDWLVLRADNREDLSQIAPNLAAKHYKRVKEFDRRADIEKLDIAGRNLLLFDSHFAVYQRRHNPMSLTFDGQVISPESYTGKFEVRMPSYANRDIASARAPNSLTFEQVPGITRVSGEFGILPSAWNGSKKTSGVIFEIEQIHPDQSTNVLFSQTLRPVEETGERSIQRFSAAVPTISNAKLRFITRLVDPTDEASCHTFWDEITADIFSATIAWHESAVSSIDCDAPNGIKIMDEQGHDVTFAHAPSRIVYQIPPGAHRLSGKIGLLRKAYTGKGNTDGVTFILESESADGQRTVLMKRLLQPHTVPSDQGTHDFSISLPSQKNSKLFLVTTPGPTGRFHYTWSFWQDLRFDP